MSDELKNRGVQDRNLISLEERHEVAYWDEGFGVTKDELVRAVAQVGRIAAAVREYLKSSWWRPTAA